MKSIFVIGAGALLLVRLSAAASVSDKPTFSRDIAPILNQRCVTCHRPGEAGPMAFTSYKEVRPWAAAIKQAVALRTMPPWHADPTVNHFANDRRLSDDEVATVVKWAETGAPEGNAAQTPKLPKFVDGWQFGQPDFTISTGTPFVIPANGTIPYKYYTVDPGFTEDMWVQAVEVRPSQRTQVHHILVFVLEEGNVRPTRGGEAFSDMLIGYAPGVPYINFDPDTAFLVKAGSKFRFQVHYTTNGKEATDIDSLGLKIRKDKPKYRAYCGSASQRRLAIPPQEANYEAKATHVFKEDVTLLDMSPHMHLRGKAFQYVLTYPDGRSEELLKVPKYDFNWQISYVLDKPLKIPAGSKMEATAWYDNSPNNKFNPDPSKLVRWGDQTFEEMMIGFFNYKVPVDSPGPVLAKPVARPPAE